MVRKSCLAAAMLAATSSATWILQGNGYIAAENGTVPATLGNYFWLESSLDTDTNEFVLTSQVKVIL